MLHTSIINLTFYYIRSKGNIRMYAFVFLNNLKHTVLKVMQGVEFKLRPHGARTHTPTRTGEFPTQRRLRRKTLTDSDDDAVQALLQLGRGHLALRPGEESVPRWASIHLHPPCPVPCAACSDCGHSLRARTRWNSHSAVTRVSWAKGVHGRLWETFRLTLSPLPM